jgi:hypothetical protein
VKLTLRLRVAEEAASRFVRHTAGRSVCDRIEELTALFLEHPPAFTYEIEAGILAAVERDERAAALPGR